MDNPKSLFALTLELTIERNILHEMAAELGRTHPDVLEQSRKVDGLVLQLQGRFAA